MLRQTNRCLPPDSIKVKGGLSNKPFKVMLNPHEEDVHGMIQKTDNGKVGVWRAICAATSTSGRKRKLRLLISRSSYTWVKSKPMCGIPQIII